MTATALAGPGARHEALFHAGLDEFVSAASSFVAGGLERDEPVLMLLTRPKRDALREALDGSAAEIEWAEMERVGRNPARIIPVWSDFVHRHAGRHAHVRGIGEPVYPGRSPEELVECHRHESLINVAFAETPGLYVLCPYDTDALAPEDVEAARQSHPHVRRNGASETSPAFVGVEAAGHAFTEPLPEPPHDVGATAFDRGRLRSLRGVVAGRARAAGLPEDAVEAIVLAVNEAAANSVRHGGGTGTFRVWPVDGGLACEVRDAGRLDHLPLVGRVRPRPDQEGGRGLWLVNQLCDLVQIRSSAAGTTVRMIVRAG